MDKQIELQRILKSVKVDKVESEGFDYDKWRRETAVERLEDAKEKELIDQKIKATAYRFMTGTYPSKKVQAVFNKYLDRFPVFKGYGKPSVTPWK